MSLFPETNDADAFLQMQFDLNIICYFEKDNLDREFYRFCYREREIHNLNPQVKIGTNYSVHYALLKALNLGRGSFSEYADKR